MADHTALLDDVKVFYTQPFSRCKDIQRFQNVYFGYFKALLKNLTNKIQENGHFCDFIAVSNKLKIHNAVINNFCRFEYKCNPGLKIE